MATNSAGSIMNERVRPMGGLNALVASDDDTEDDENPTTNPNDMGDAPADASGDINEEGDIVADELVVKKKARNSKPFTEDVLTLPDGLQRIYEEFPVSCKFRGRGSEARDIKKLMAMYKEWAFQLHPGLSYCDVLSKCESLGGKGKTRGCVADLRDRERDRYIIDVLGVRKEDMQQNQRQDPLSSPPQPSESTAPLPNTTGIPDHLNAPIVVEEPSEADLLAAVEAAEAAAAAAAAEPKSAPHGETPPSSANVGRVNKRIRDNDEDDDEEEELIVPILTVSHHDSALEHASADESFESIMTSPEAI
eukprot:CAMPEP_0174965678 /NCGR_PEP_ID=MMETSP0004_2-20121128/6567_1 /TAXON_ID=420556 /ORGANISM="Ochromonas sp., Strain CCMP1393" /LENGTH=306 /DNA_ID=CAMNT_0016214537 /DNA_START=38 /DNA_END=958 /DNA_ORIENTATION=+